MRNGDRQAEGSIARMLDSCSGDRPTQPRPILNSRTLGGGGSPAVSFDRDRKSAVPQSG
ncbi:MULTISPECIES: hypothetical protein [unclassified Microcoleus]|uniref:hypothetical protein n=1 Tax=unclassified Microcoleus TaxID=2642155 RepID=UPI002FCF4F6C